MVFTQCFLTWPNFLRCQALSALSEPSSLNALGLSCFTDHPKSSSSSATPVKPLDFSSLDRQQSPLLPFRSTCNLVVDAPSNCDSKSSTHSSPSPIISPREAAIIVLFTVFSIKFVRRDGPRMYFVGREPSLPESDNNMIEKLMRISSTFLLRSTVVQGRSTVTPSKGWGRYNLVLVNSKKKIRKFKKEQPSQSPNARSCSADRLRRSRRGRRCDLKFFQISGDRSLG
ncbi:hypothetical protein KSP39_PZI007863 [Platanthera zijinensis]|uniref:Uncharacterized protein n=1 Tax=Platanthera zijinensis TaxID=2320716 RepID=A0AAP0BN73_9ASPA